MQMRRIMQLVTELPRRVTQQAPEALVVVNPQPSALMIFSPKPVGLALHEQSKPGFQLRTAEDERSAHRMGIYIY